MKTKIEIRVDNNETVDRLTKSKKGKLYKQVMFIDLEYVNDSDVIKERTYSDIISIGCYICELIDNSYKVIDTYYTLVQPKHPLSERISKLTNITEKDLNKNAISLDEMLRNIKGYVYKSSAIFYYGDSDVKCIRRNLKYLKGTNLRNILITMTQKMRGLNIEMKHPSKSLNLQAGYYLFTGDKISTTHNALDDARLLYYIVNNIIQPNNNMKYFISDIIDYYNFREATRSIKKGLSMLSQMYSEKDIKAIIQEVQENEDIVRCTLMEYLENNAPVKYDSNLV